MVERWSVYEVTLNGPSTGNPFTEVELTAEFKRRDTNGEQTFKPQGFYDGDGVYKIRFMPDAVGEWTYTTKSNTAELNGKDRTVYVQCTLRGKSRTRPCL